MSRNHGKLSGLAQISIRVTQKLQIFTKNTQHLSKIIRWCPKLIQSLKKVQKTTENYPDLLKFQSDLQKITNNYPKLLIRAWPKPIQNYPNPKNNLPAPP
jgi:hypothetical protein